MNTCDIKLETNGGAEGELPVERGEHDVESGAESFLTDDELAYQQGMDPVEDVDTEDEDLPCSSAETARNHTSTQCDRRSRPRSPQSQDRSRSPIQLRSGPGDTASSWKSERDLDIVPKSIRFTPARPPGHQLNTNSTYTPLDLFKLFLSNEAASTISNHTNKQAAKNVACGKKYSWTDLNRQEFFKFVGLTFYFALVKLENIQGYWKRNTIFSVPFPANVMVRDRFRMILWNIHMSDPEEDVENDKKKGTPGYDHLFRLRPFLDNLKHAFRTYYHPKQNLTVQEKVVTKAHYGFTHFMKPKPKAKRDFKLFVLSDCSNGYTLDISVYTGKGEFASGVGLAYDSVMSLIKPAHLGQGYHLYVDQFYTSTKLFKDLHSMNIGACGMYRDKRKHFPRTKSNALRKSSPRGSIRWIREDPLLFVKWKDTSEVSVCSTIHQARAGNLVRRRERIKSSEILTKYITCPSPVLEYNKQTVGVESFDHLIQYFSTHHESIRWYRTLFFQLLDIAVTNSFILHKELCKEKQEEPMNHRAFLEELTAQLCGVTVAAPAAKAQCSHMPVAISQQSDSSKKASYGRKTCIRCRQTRKLNLSTPWKCKECDVALCLIQDRNCFDAWHS
ncbi:piggyBac transposable element-derived protein 4-like [Notolabrus celidotus]|uniref:piggyBac transposable element-derived protein 4-like n=1 Tax=Notolabrus celidotus TaxID=1203425 RepID=UPI0014900F59|nr:piggyBac transposable element-derived protein 4-like [Notolabrus celidotus]